MVMKMEKSLEDRGYKKGDIIKEFTSGKLHIKIVYEGKKNE